VQAPLELLRSKLLGFWPYETEQRISNLEEASEADRLSRFIHLGQPDVLRNMRLVITAVFCSDLDKMFAITKTAQSSFWHTSDTASEPNETSNALSAVFKISTSKYVGGVHVNSNQRARRCVYRLLGWATKITGNAMPLLLPRLWAQISMLLGRTNQTLVRHHR
jgi:hypothetical protein